MKKLILSLGFAAATVFAAQAQETTPQDDQSQSPTQMQEVPPQEDVQPQEEMQPQQDVPTEDTTGQSMPMDQQTPTQYDNEDSISDTTQGMSPQSTSPAEDQPMETPTEETTPPKQ